MAQVARGGRGVWHRWLGEGEGCGIGVAGGYKPTSPSKQVYSSVDCSNTVKVSLTHTSTLSKEGSIGYHGDTVTSNS